MDEDVVVFGDPFDAEILDNTLLNKSIDENIKNIEDDTVCLSLRTLNEEQIELNKLRNFSLQSEVGVQIFEALYTLENSIEKATLNLMQ